MLLTGGSRGLQAPDKPRQQNGLQPRAFTHSRHPTTRHFLTSLLALILSTAKDLGCFSRHNSECPTVLLTPHPTPVILSEGSRPQANRSRRTRHTLHLSQPVRPFQPQTSRCFSSNLSRLSFRRNLLLALAVALFPHPDKSRHPDPEQSRRGRTPVLAFVVAFAPAFLVVIPEGNLCSPTPATPSTNTPDRKGILSVAEWISTVPQKATNKKKGRELKLAPSINTNRSVRKQRHLIKVPLAQFCFRPGLD